MDKMSQERYNRSRERNDRISALMGQYMLRGYRMLGSVCEVCGVGELNSLSYSVYRTHFVETKVTFVSVNVILLNFAYLSCM